MLDYSDSLHSGSQLYCDEIGDLISLPLNSS